LGNRGRFALPTLIIASYVSIWAQTSGSLAAPTAADIAAGERTFGSQCAYCHGPKGEGAIGPALAVPRLRRVQDEDGLIQVIRDGIPGTGMPASAMTGTEARQTAAYVSAIGRLSQNGLPGDARRGEELFMGKGRCIQCHTVAGRGGAVGPDLAGIGGRRGSAELRTSLLDPETSVASNFLQVRVTTKNGEKVTGVRVNEDTFSIQLRDLSNTLHSFWKSTLTDIVKEPGRSPMPSYRNVLSGEEVDDLVSYLMSLKAN